LKGSYAFLGNSFIFHEEFNDFQEFEKLEDAKKAVSEMDGY